jgi:hypothetical protein
MHLLACLLHGRARSHCQWLLIPNDLGHVAVHDATSCLRLSAVTSHEERLTRIDTDQASSLPLRRTFLGHP